MAVIYVARHGETDWNCAGRYQGRLESNLTERGERQADALASALANSGVRRVIASPLRRCRDTAAPLARLLGLELELDDRLVEIGHGTWEGRLREDIEREDPHVFAAWKTQPDTVHFDGGESLAEVLARWRAFAASLDGKDDVAIVTHDVLVRLAVLEAEAKQLTEFWNPRVLNGGYARLQLHDGMWSVEDPCVDHHLGELIADTRVQAL